METENGNERSPEVERVIIGVKFVAWQSFGESRWRNRWIIANVYELRLCSWKVRFCGVRY